MWRFFIRSIQILLILAMTGLACASLVWHPFTQTTRTSAEVTQRRSAKSSRANIIEVLSEDAVTREVRHAAGVSRIPRNPQRICALAFVDELTALSIKPYAMASGRSWALYEDYLDDKIASVIQLPYGHFYDVLPCFDAIAELKPDLILASVADRNTYEQLSVIAPTLVLRDMRSSQSENVNLDALKQRLRDLAIALGRTDASDAYIREFDAELAEARTQIGAEVRGKTMAYFRTRWGRWLLFGGTKENSGSGPEALYKELGLRAPATGRGVGTDLDFEDLIDFDADYIIAGADDTVGAPEAMREMAGTHFFKNSTAARTGHVYELTKTNHWWFSGISGKRRMLREILACVRQGEHHEQH